MATHDTLPRQFFHRQTTTNISKNKIWEYLYTYIPETYILEVGFQHNGQEKAGALHGKRSATGKFTIIANSHCLGTTEFVNLPFVETQWKNSSSLSTEKEANHLI